MIIPKEYTVIRHIAHLAGVSIPIEKISPIMYCTPIIVEEGNQSPHTLQYTSTIHVGSEWLQNNLSDEEMAQWVALRLLGKLDKLTKYKDKFSNIANYGGINEILMGSD